MSRVQKATALPLGFGIPRAIPRPDLAYIVVQALGRDDLGGHPLGHQHSAEAPDWRRQRAHLELECTRGTMVPSANGTPSLWHLRAAAAALLFSWGAHGIPVRAGSGRVATVLTLARRPYHPAHSRCRTPKIPGILKYYTRQGSCGSGRRIAPFCTEYVSFVAMLGICLT